MIISVFGSASVEAQPDRALVRLRVHAQGDTVRVGERVRATAAALGAELAALVEGGHATAHTLSQLRLNSWQPSGPNGEPLPTVHEANAELSVTFSDLDELSRFTEREFDLSIAVDGIDWRLSDELRQGHRELVLRSAVDDAWSRARTMADAAGLADIELVQLSDAGADPGMGQAMGMQAMARKMDFVPGEQAITEQVLARFEAK